MLLRNSRDPILKHDHYAFLPRIWGSLGLSLPGATTSGPFPIRCNVATLAMILSADRQKTHSLARCAREFKSRNDSRKVQATNPISQSRQVTHSLRLFDSDRCICGGRTGRSIEKKYTEKTAKSIKIIFNYGPIK